ncbi:MAG: hypothetical protein OXU81_24435 [Gammaproteobacteria bacterium]|nr:hypothetical protein [Gammaproteobacteria bacterium]
MRSVSGGDGSSAGAGGSPTDGSGSATEHSVFDGTWLVTDKNVSGYRDDGVAKHRADGGPHETDLRESVKSATAMMTCGR